MVTVTPFADEAEAIALANDTPYGLSGSIWTSNVGRAIRVARGVETGNLSVNSHSSVRYWTPFGGFKQSGLGRELGPDAVDAFTETKNVFIANRLRERGRFSMQRLQDRVVVVTGAGSGIGLASARRLAAEGARIVAVDIDEAAGKAAAAETGGAFVAANVADEEQVRDLFDGVAGRFGRIDVAFNNAGISPPDDDSILTTGLDAWRRVQEVNLTSVYLCCKYVLPHMQRRARARSSTPRRSWPCSARRPRRSPTPRPRAACWR